MAFSLMVVFGFGALAVDLGQLYLTQALLQVAATSAAAAAALDLPDEAAAAITAVAFAEANMPPADHGNVLASDDVQTGHWDEVSGTFTASGTPRNAVRVTTRRDTSQGNGVVSIFGRFLGVNESSLFASATAMLLPDLVGAVGAAGSVNITGNVTIDSYDSSEGPYDPTSAGEDGDIIAGGDVSVGGSAEINGDVRGENVSTSGGASVSGDTSGLRRPVDFPPVDISGVENSNVRRHGL
jgi:hypothetical protein